MRLIGLIAALVCAAPLFAAPGIHWVSDPVAPDETVVILGEGLEAGAVVELLRLADGPAGQPGSPEPRGQFATLKPLQVSGRCIKAVLPPNAIPTQAKGGLYALRVRQGEAVSNTLLANEPNPWWFQGDEGRLASPGGWLRIFGKCLGTAAATVLLRDAAGQDRRLAVKAANGWSLNVPLPADLPRGDHEVFVHNGWGGPAGWRRAGRLSVVAPVTQPPTMILVANTGDTDKAIHEALEKAAKSGGGIVFLPRGSYDVKSALVIPPRTVLRGEGMGLVSLYVANTPDPPESWISGRDYGLEELSLYCFNYRRVISDTPDSERLRLHHVRVRAVPEAVRHTVKKNNKEPLAALHITGRNYRITGCDVYGALPGNAQGRVLVTGPWGFARDQGPWYGVISDSEFYGHMYGCENYKAVIFERNKVTGVCFSATTYWNNFAQDLYCADNDVRHVYGGDREIMTFDAGGGAYFGAAKATGTHLTLAAEPQFKDYAPRAHTDYRGAAVFILDGTGAGQWRQVTANQGREWELDRPWTVAPDDTSRFSIVPFRGRNLFIGNRFVDGGAVQLYGSAADVILAGNTGARIDGFFTWGLNPHGWGWQPSFCCQFLDNELTEGSGYGGRVWGPSFFGVTTGDSNAQYPGPLARATIFRRNVMQTQSYLNLGGKTEDTLVERCTVKHSPVGVRVTKDVHGTVLRGNRFEEVAKPLDGDGAAGALVVP